MGGGGAPFLHVHRVRFEEIDAAGIAYFPRFFTWCHDAMEALFGSLPGGYAGLVRDRRLGFPAVHVEADFSSPMRFGESVVIAVTVERLGRSSAALRFDLTNESTGGPVATVRHVVAFTDMAAMRSSPLPQEIRALLERHQI